MLKPYYENQYGQIYHGDFRDVLPELPRDRFDLFLADPPYGMRKEADGVVNDNIYREELDAFIMECWNLALPTLRENASAYIWGNAEDLWRLWFVGGLKESTRLDLRNELVWDKEGGMGQNSEGHHQYATATERCLFLMRGQQFLGSQNVEDYWEGYEPLRQWLIVEKLKAGFTAKRINEITETWMHGHWFTKSQFTIINEENYNKLQEAAAGTGFACSYDEMMEHVEGVSEYKKNLNDAMHEKRSYFNNTHDNMTDVWKFNRVIGDERWDHATPKPVDIFKRMVLSSCPESGWVLDPFLGSGTTAHACCRARCNFVGIEIQEEYCEASAKRLEQFRTGLTPQEVANGVQTLFDD